MVVLATTSLKSFGAEAFGGIALARAVGERPSPAAYEQLMLSCVDSGAAVAAYRLYEEAAADGLRWRQLSPTARSVLQPMLPPEAESLRSSRRLPRLRLPLGRSAQPFCDPLPELWLSPSGSVAEFDCRAARGAAARDEALARAWTAVERRDSPVIFRGVGDAWPATRQWDLPLLRRTLRRAMVRVSPGPAVTFAASRTPTFARAASRRPRALS